MKPSKSVKTIEKTFETEKVEMKVRSKDGKLSSISVNRKDTGKHLFCLRQLEKNNSQPAQNFLWQLTDMLITAQGLFPEPEYDNSEDTKESPTYFG